MAYLDCHGDYCSIARKSPEGMQHIVLSRVEWLKLCRLSSKVSSYMERNTTEGSQREEEQSWTLTPEARVGTVSGQPWKTVMTKLTLNCYKQAPYCNTRVYVADAPSKQGVTLNTAEWFSVRNRLSNPPGSELHLAEKAYKKLLTEAITKAIPERCVGCKENWPSQTDHECIVGRGSLIHRLGEDVPVSVFTFQHELTLLAKERHVMLETAPSDLFDVCDNLLKPEIIDDLCKADAELDDELEPLLIVDADGEDKKQTPPPPLLPRAIKERGKRTGFTNRHSPYP